MERLKVEKEDSVRNAMDTAKKMIAAAQSEVDERIAKLRMESEARLSEKEDDIAAIKGISEEMLQSN